MFESLDLTARGRFADLDDKDILAAALRMSASVTVVLQSTTVPNTSNNKAFGGFSKMPLLVEDIVVDIDSSRNWLYPMCFPCKVHRIPEIKNPDDENFKQIRALPPGRAEITYWFALISAEHRSIYGLSVSGPL
jgi:hypothetical protein